MHTWCALRVRGRVTQREFFLIQSVCPTLCQFPGRLEGSNLGVEELSWVGRLLLACRGRRLKANWRRDRPQGAAAACCPATETPRHDVSAARAPAMRVRVGPHWRRSLRRRALRQRVRRQRFAASACGGPALAHSRIQSDSRGAPMAQFGLGSCQRPMWIGSFIYLSCSGGSVRYFPVPSVKSPDTVGTGRCLRSSIHRR